MSSSPWDPRVGPRPNLASLSLLDRERLSRPIPLRPWETYGLLCLFQTLATNQPNARVYASAYRVKENASAPVATDGVQLDFTDYSGKVPAASVILTREHARSTIVGLLQAYAAVGGDVEELLSEAKTVPVPRPPQPIYFEENNRD